MGEVGPSLFHCQKGLAKAWLLLSFGSFVVIILQTTIGNAFVSPRGGDIQARVWQWYLPSVLPTLSLVLGVLSNAELRPNVRVEAQRKQVSVFFYRTTFALSVVYASLVLLMVVFTGAKDNAEEKVALLERSHFFLAPLQSLVSLALGVFFLSPESTSTAADESEPIVK
jgi:hypothetical protein